MFDFSSIVPYSQFNTWFHRCDENSLIAVTRSGDYICDIKETPSGAVIEKDDPANESVLADFEVFKNSRPEYILGKKIEITSDIESLIDTYEKLLIACALVKYMQAGKDIDKINYTRSVTWLRTTDFYSAPASTQYHESYAGGLLVHSLNVYNRILDLRSTRSFENTDLVSAALVALVHDWCKIGLYESYMRNVKNEDTGKWEQVTAYKHNQTGVPLGHGVTSMFLAGRLFNLSVEESLAIRWHQGRWNVCREEVNEFQKANEEYPLVHLLQFADQLAIVSY